MLMGVRENVAWQMVKNLLQMVLKMQILKLKYGVIKNYQLMSLLQKLRS